jgi:hypothetical protein
VEKLTLDTMLPQDYWTGFDQMSDAAVTALTQLALLQCPLATATRARALVHAGVQTDYLGSSLQR